MRIVVEKVALGQVSLEYFGFNLSVSFPQTSILIFVYVLLLPQGQTGEVWGPSKK